MQIDLSMLIGGFIGLLLVWLARFLVGWLVKRVKKGIPLPPPSAAIEKKWADLTADTKEDKSGAILGDLERVLFYLAFWLGAQEIIAGWFALKVASKWEAWGTTGRLPEALEGMGAFPKCDIVLLMILCCKEQFAWLLRTFVMLLSFKKFGCFAGHISDKDIPAPREQLRA